MTDRVELTCIECPTGCTVTVEVESGKALAVEGFGCRRGHDYAVTEVECPTRMLTTTVVAHGLSVQMVPVRTTSPVPRGRLMDAVAETRKIRVRRPVRVGDVILADILGLGIDVVATREIS